MPLLLLLSPVPVEAPLEPADKGVVPPVGLLLLLPLHGVVPGLVFVHLPRVDVAPPDVKLVLTHLELQAPLLGVGMANLVLEAGLGECLVDAALPGAGVADAGVMLDARKENGPWVEIFTPVTARMYLASHLRPPDPLTVIPSVTLLPPHQ